MNTEAMNTLKLVREGINFLQVQLSDQELASDEKSLLADALISLEEFEDIIINNLLREMVDKINASNKQLKQLLVRMKASTEKIAAYSKVIKKISDTVGILAQITAKAISAGIL